MAKSKKGPSGVLYRKIRMAKSKGTYGKKVGHSPKKK